MIWLVAFAVLWRIRYEYKVWLKNRRFVEIFYDIPPVEEPKDLLLEEFEMLERQIRAREHAAEEQRRIDRDHKFWLERQAMQARCPHPHTEVEFIQAFGCEPMGLCRLCRYDVSDKYLYRTAVATSTAQSRLTRLGGPR